MREHDVVLCRGTIVGRADHDHVLVEFVHEDGSGDLACVPAGDVTPDAGRVPPGVIAGVMATAEGRDMIERYCLVPFGYRMIPSEPTDEMVERVMEAVAEEFGACSNKTADRIIAAAFSTHRSPEEDR